jgi:hypothetical protein
MSPAEFDENKFRRGIFIIMTNINQAINQQDVFLQAIQNYVPYPG